MFPYEEFPPVPFVIQVQFLFGRHSHLEGGPCFWHRPGVGAKAEWRGPHAATKKAQRTKALQVPLHLDLQSDPRDAATAAAGIVPTSASQGQLCWRTPSR